VFGGRRGKRNPFKELLNLAPGLLFVYVGPCALF
jgi:hypothetical protein